MPLDFFPSPILQATLDKGLKMKIKRTKPGTKSSEAKHEIVKSEQNGNSAAVAGAAGGVNPLGGGPQVTPAAVAVDGHSEIMANNKKYSGGAQTVGAAQQGSLPGSGVTGAIGAISGGGVGGVSGTAGLNSSMGANNSGGNHTNNGTGGGNSALNSSGASSAAMTNSGLSASATANVGSSGGAAQQSSNKRNSSGHRREKGGGSGKEKMTSGGGGASASSASLKEKNPVEVALSVNTTTTTNSTAGGALGRSCACAEAATGGLGGLQTGSSCGSALCIRLRGGLPVEAGGKTESRERGTLTAAASAGDPVVGNKSAPSDSSRTQTADREISSPPAKKMRAEPREMQDACVGTSVGTITEPDCLGPCEPGTSVTLEGIVWHETEGGVLVVNVTWRGKTYVGTLLDCTRHDWAPPR